jgi:hypothetical protein
MYSCSGRRDTVFFVIVEDVKGAISSFLEPVSRIPREYQPSHGSLDSHYLRYSCLGSTDRPLRVFVTGLSLVIFPVMLIALVLPPESLGQLGT